MTLILLASLYKATLETLYMTFASLVLSGILGFGIGILLFITSDGGFYKNKLLHRLSDFVVNLFRAIPFILILILFMPLAKLLTGSVLGVHAAIPSLVIAASPFYARLCVIAFLEVDKGTFEAARAMGASNWQMIYKILLPESMPALLAGLVVTAINLISYTAMAGAIGSGGLGYLAYQYGFARRNYPLLFTATLLIVLIVLLLQALGDRWVKYIDKRKS